MFVTFTRRELLARLASLLFAAVCGACITLVLVGHQADRLAQENADLMNELEDLLYRVTLLEERRGPGLSPYIEAIEVQAAGLERDGPPVEQALRSKLMHLIGEEIDRVNATTVAQAVEGPLVVDRQTYHITVDTIYVAPTLRIEVSARLGG